MKIRRARKTDALSIARLIRQTIATVNAGDYSSKQRGVWSNRITPSRMAERYDSVIQYVVEEDGKVIGMGDINKDKAEVDFLYVHKNWIGKGVGSKLLSRLEKEAKRAGIRKLKVTSSITAKPFFASKGFIAAKKGASELDGQKFNVYKMEKRL